MKSFKINEKDHGRHVVRVITGIYTGIHLNAVRHALKNRDIRVNGKRIRDDVQVYEGDEVAVYLSDDILEGREEVKAGPKDAAGSSAKTGSAASRKSMYKSVYSDENIIVVNKRPKLAVHSGEGITGLTLIDMIREDFNDSGINLCHRIDMNTGGLVILARNDKAVREIAAALKTGAIYKRYRCLVKGKPATGKPVVCEDKTKMFELRAFLERDQSSKDVYIHDVEKPGDLEIVTKYRILNKYDGAGPDGEPVSELEVELSSGRMHQIRAHLAHLGNPLLGDGKYGRNAYNRNFRTENGYLRYQQLWATSIHFLELPSGSLLSYLSGRVFKCSADFDIKF